MSTYEFCYPYTLDGKIAAEIDGRCEFTVTSGDDREIDYIGGVEIWCLDARQGRPYEWPRSWCDADEALAARIINWLRSDADAASDMFDIAAEDAEGDRADHACEQYRADLMEDAA